MDLHDFPQEIWRYVEANCDFLNVNVIEKKRGVNHMLTIDEFCHRFRTAFS